MKAWSEAALPTESEYQGHIIELAHLYRWRVAHFRPAQTSRGWRTPVSADGAGFPDLFMVRGRRAIAAELKRDEKAKLTPAQLDWLADIRAAGIEAYVWVASRDDIAEIALVLR
jgi:VRR-NUC domain-containing protein